MADMHAGTVTAGEQRHTASAAKLRALARPGFDLRMFLRNITAVEIAAMSGLLLLVVAVVFIYFGWILPDQVKRLQLSSEVSANNTKIEELKSQAGDPGAVAAAYRQVHDSLDAFRAQTLQPRTAGRLTIINLVTDLTRETGVALDGPISFEAKNPLEEAAREQETKSGRKTRKADDEIRIYPSLRIAMTISGSYPQLREFLAKFESSRQFAIIESVYLSSGEEETESDEPRSGRRGGDVDSGAISLEISMIAYFQPDGTVAVIAPDEDQAPPAP